MDCLALASTCYASATANPFQPPRLDNPLHCGDYDAHHHHQHQPHQHRPGMMPDSVETVGHVATTISEPHIDLGSKAAPAVRLLGPVDTPDTLTSEVPTSHARQRHTNPAVLPSIALKKGIDIERYKTQLCKTFRKTGQCPYFDRCMFAHGARELRTAEQNAELVAAMDATKRPKGRKPSSDPPQDVVTSSPCTDAWIHRRLSGTPCRYRHDPYRVDSPW